MSSPTVAAPVRATVTRVLVTGASGFVGGVLAPALRAAFPAADLVAAGREAAPPAGYHRAVPYDLLDPATAGAAVRDARPDAVVHLAALSAVAESFRDPDAVWRANVDGARALAAALLAHAPGAVLVHASSAEVYGLSFQGPGALDEGAPMRPANPYAAAKAAADLALGEMALRGLRVVRLRPLNHTGPGQEARFALPAFARQVARIEAGLQEPVIRTGALDRERDVLDARDVAAAYVAAIARAGALAPGAAYNLASGALRRLDAVVADLARLAGIEARVEPRAEAMRPVDLARTALDSSAARADLAWAPRVPWETTLRDLLDHWRARVRAEG